jgi:phosphatidylserine decarboxylase
MITTRSWRAARAYVLPFLVLGAGLASARRRVAVVPFVVATVLLVFFRDPDRPLVRDRSLIYAASDGVVTDVESTDAPWLPIEAPMRISTFLSLHNVHVTRSPAAGAVTSREELRRAYLPALSRQCAARNTQSRFTVDGPLGQVGIVLVAGALARRITPWVDVGDRVEAGSRLGIIHFGSRTDVVLASADVEPLVRRGKRVRAGVTPIARLRTPAPA